MKRLRDCFHSARRIFRVYSRETEKLKLLDVITIKWHNNATTSYLALQCLEVCPQVVVQLATSKVSKKIL